MKDTITLLLCAVALAQGINQNPEQRRGPCNCDPSEAQQICQDNYDNDDILIAHENCNKFYKCANGKPVAYFCPNNLLYDPFTETCEWPYNVDCGDRPIAEGPIKEEDSDSDDVSDTDNNWTCNCNPGEAPSICAAEGSNGIVVAHQNCNQFYKCAEGKPVTFDCSPSLLYNPYTEQCDWPQNVECGDRVIPEPEDNNSSDDDDTTENDGTCNCNPEEAPAICAAPGSENVLIAHENCNKYYICNHGSPVVNSCFGDLLFNPYTKQCDWPRNVDCGDRIVPETECTGCNDDTSGDASCDGDDESPPSEPPINSEPEDSDSSDLRPPSDDVVVPTRPPGTCNCRPEEAPSICAAEDSDGVLVAHENCNQFYKCDHGKPVVLYCHGDLLYNPYTEQCDWPENVDCGDRVIPDPTVTTPIVINPTVTTPVVTNPVVTTPGVTNPTRPPGTCNCRPEEAPSICAAEDSDGVLVAHENCNQFYKCEHGKPVALKCYGNLLYNPYTEQCDWPENVDCGDRVIPDPVVTTPVVTNPVVTTPGVTNQPGTTPGVTNPGNNCDPNEAPAICAADDSDGVLVAHENCNQFYKCSEGKPVALYCPDGLLFNPAKDQCDWPFNVDCGDRVIPDPEILPPDSESAEIQPPGDGVVVPTRPPGTCNCRPEEAPSICAAEDSDGVLVAHENCNQFYKCDHGKPIVLKCYGNLLYNPYTEQCDWPENVDCGDRVIPDPVVTTPVVTNPVVTTPGVTNQPGTTPGVTNPGNNCDPNEAPAICAADDSDGVLVAHENCNQFYKCSEGKPVALYCPDGLLFNPAKDQCDWPFNVDCGDRVIPDPEILPPDSESAEIQPPGDGVVVPTRPPGTCNCRPEEAPSICAAEDSDGVLVAHENCNQFYKCDHGKPIVLKCYGNLLYNPYTEQCDWPENVDCGDRVIPDPVVTTPVVTNPVVTTPGVTNQPGTTPGVTNPGNNCDPNEAPAICAADDSDGVLVAHENCNQFYKCSEGKPVALDCPDGLLFNPAKDQCDWPFNVDCGDRVIPDPEILPPDSESAEIQPPGDGVVVPTRPPGTCNCRPEEAPSICAAEDSDGVLVAHENCNQFYKCEHGKPVALKCYGNLLYNPYTEQCDWPENVECGDRVIPDPAVTTPVVTNPVVTTPGVTNQPGTTPGVTNPGNNCDPNEAPAICAADNSDGVLVAHENCNQFYKCSEGNPVALYCPDGLLFNPAKDQCDWPFNVDCGDRVIPDPEILPPDSESAEIQPPGDAVITTPVATNPPVTTPVVTNPASTTPVVTNPVVTTTVGTTVDDDCSGNSGENSGQCNCDPDQAPSICSMNNSDGVLIAHDNCHQFYKCDNGVPVPFRCPVNTLYNPVSQVCDWAFNVDCGDRIITEPEDDINESKEDESEEEVIVGPCNCNPEEAPAICAVDGSSGVQIAHQNCNQYYVCNHGRPVAASCSGFLLYNPYTQSCDWPQNVECGDRLIPDPVSDECDDETEEDNNNVGNDDPSQAPAICAGYGSEGVLVAHENCDQYYICTGGVPVTQLCNVGLLFNPNNHRCDWPSNVVCGNRIVPDDCACNPRNAPALCSHPGSQGKLIAHENCNQYYICDHSSPVAQFCPDGLLYNIDKEWCDWSQNVNCENRILSSASLNKHWQSRQTLRN